MDRKAHCTQCGARLEERYVEDRERRYCSNCDRIEYRNPKPCAGILVVDDNELLLVERTEPPAVGAWSIPAGYLESDEPPATAAVRELREETGVRIDEEPLSLFDTTLVEHPDGQHVLVILYVAPATEAAGDPRAGGDAGAARFWSLRALRSSAERVEPGYEALFERVVNAVENPTR
jgi:ADP-ribose pyrophosphatase YjhB (NUDIX family)